MKTRDTHTSCPKCRIGVLHVHLFSDRRIVLCSCCDYESREGEKGKPTERDEGE